MTYEQAKAFTLKAEGGLTTDNGGLTMCGVTQSVYDNYCKLHSKPHSSVATISSDEVDDIMHAEYWNPAHCDSLPAKVAIAMFDWAYNHGPSGAIMTLQACVGVDADGVFGTHTLDAVRNAGDGLLGKFLDARRHWYQAAAEANPAKYSVSLHGWMNRVDALEKYLGGL